MVLNDDAQQRGWSIAVSVEIKFRDAATSMAFDLGIVLMNDYTFLVGAGQQPGILAMSSDELRLCVAHYPSDFMALPALRLPVEWPSEVADRKAHPNRKLDSSTAPFGEGTPLRPLR